MALRIVGKSVKKVHYGFDKSYNFVSTETQKSELYDCL